jgi:hypothetical protein
MVQYKVGVVVLYARWAGLWQQYLCKLFFFARPTLQKSRECFFSFVNNETLCTIYSIVEVPDKLLQQIFARVLASLTAEARVRSLTGRVCLFF